MQEQNSVLSNTHKVSVTKWVVGMLRKPNSKDPHHVILVVEGRNSFGQALLRRYDLYIDEQRKSEKNDENYAKIIIKPDVFCAHQDTKTSLDMLVNAEEYYVKSWPISADTARILHDNILETQKNPPIYNLSGDESSCNRKSEKIDGAHSCYTWARYELKRIGLDVPKNTLDNIIAVPDFVIKPEGQEKNTSFSWCRMS